MTRVLGFELTEACELLEKEGYTVEIEEARSIKGVAGSDSNRVIRQIESDRPMTVRLGYARFKTAVDVN